MKTLTVLPTVSLASAASAMSVFLCALGFIGCERWDLDKTSAIAVRPQPAPYPSIGPAKEDTGFLRQEAKAFGIYQWNKDQSYGDGLDHEIGNLGTHPAYALYFVDKAMGFPEAIVRFNNERKIRTIITQELSEYSVGWDDGVLDSIQAGVWDSYFRRFAREARSIGDIVYYRFGYEMNGDWVSWGEKPEAFRLAWRRAWRIFREEKAKNVRWVFSPNVIWEDRSFETDILPYYPGHDFVDIVGLDGYNFGDKHSRHHTWRTYDDVFAKSLKGMKTHFKDKPLWITEIGCAEGEGKAAWIRDFLHRFNADPDIRAFIWFNEDKQYAGEPNWRLDSEPASLETFRDWAIRNSSITTFALPMGMGKGMDRGPGAEVGMEADSAHAYLPRSEGI